VDTIILINILRGIYAIAQLYWICMFLAAVMSLLGMFGVINLFGEGILGRIYYVLRRIVDPAVAVVARFVPRMGAFDLPFLVFLIFLWIVSDLCQYYIFQLQMSHVLGFLLQ
jgi:uncharacterized protein YggT (Ycf19 family)